MTYNLNGSSCTIIECIAQSVLFDGLYTCLVKNPPAKEKTQVQSLGWEDSLEKGLATHSRILAWRVPWTEEPDEIQPIGSQRVRRE